MYSRSIKTSESLQNNNETYSKLHLNYNSSVFMSIRNISTETSVQCHRVQCEPKATQILRETQLQRLNEQQIGVNYLSLSTRLVRAHTNPAFDVWTWMWQEHRNSTELAVARQFDSIPGQRSDRLNPHRDTPHSFSARSISTLTISRKYIDKSLGVFYAHRGCMYLTKNTVKTVNIWNIIAI